MLAEKQVVLYSVNDAEQEILAGKKWGGLMEKYDGDYLMWVDANLGAWKTDAVIERSLSYSFAPLKDEYVATATMKFAHKGKFDWRTTRYLDYARVYLPLGSKLVGVKGVVAAKQLHPGAVDQGVENGKQWFGAFISIEPGRAGEISFQFKLSPEIVKQIKNNSYKLLAQKQIGAVAPQLTLQLNFDKNVRYANPSELSEKHGDTWYDFQGSLRTDQEVLVKLSN